MNGLRPVPGTGSQPMKIVLERRVRPGAEPAFERWVKRLLQAASRSPGFQGSSVLTAGTSGEYFILLRFAGQTDLERWQASPETVAHLAEAESISQAGPGPVVRTGLETWFTLPGLPAPAQAPPKWKMALVTWLALLPQVIALAYLVPPTVPFLLSAAISTGIPVVALTWFVMPGLARLLYGWLYAPAGRLAGGQP